MKTVDVDKLKVDKPAKVKQHPLRNGIIRGAFTLGALLTAQEMMTSCKTVQQTVVQDEKPNTVDKKGQSYGAGMDGSSYTWQQKMQTDDGRDTLVRVSVYIDKNKLQTGIGARKFAGNSADFKQETVDSLIAMNGNNCIVLGNVSSAGIANILLTNGMNTDTAKIQFINPDVQKNKDGEFAFAHSAEGFAYVDTQGNLRTGTWGGLEGPVMKLNVDLTKRVNVTMEKDGTFRVSQGESGAENVLSSGRVTRMKLEETSLGRLPSLAIKRNQPDISKFSDYSAGGVQGTNVLVLENGYWMEYTKEDFAKKYGAKQFEVNDTTIKVPYALDNPAYPGLKSRALVTLTDEGAGEDIHRNQPGASAKGSKANIKAIVDKKGAQLYEDLVVAYKTVGSDSSTVNINFLHVKSGFNVEFYDAAKVDAKLPVSKQAPMAWVAKTADMPSDVVIMLQTNGKTVSIIGLARGYNVFELSEVTVSELTGGPADQQSTTPSSTPKVKRISK